MTDGDHLRPMAQDRGFDGVGFEHSAPFRLDFRHVRAQAAPNLDLEVAEAPEDRHQQLVAGRKRGGEARLDAGPGRAVDQQGPLVLCPEHLPVERHRLAHVGRELWVELALQGHRHGPQHARVDVDGARPHQQPRLGIELGEQLGRRRHLGGGPTAVARCAIARCSQESAPLRQDARRRSSRRVSHGAGLAKTRSRLMAESVTPSDRRRGSINRRPTSAPMHAPRGRSIRPHAEAGRGHGLGVTGPDAPFACRPLGLRSASFHRQRRRQPAVLGYGHDIAPAVGGGAGHEAHLEECELGLALTRPDEGAAVGCLGHRLLYGDAGVAVVVRRKSRQQHARQVGMEPDGCCAHLIGVGGIHRRWLIGGNRRCVGARSRRRESGCRGRRRRRAWRCTRSGSVGRSRWWRGRGAHVEGSRFCRPLNDGGQALSRPQMRSA